MMTSELPPGVPDRDLTAELEIAQRLIPALAGLLAEAFGSRNDVLTRSAVDDHASGKFQTME